jgi:hypothetical protein
MKPPSDGWAKADALVNESYEREPSPYEYLLEGHKFNPNAWTAWLDALPESENVEDIRPKKHSKREK